MCQKRPRYIQRDQQKRRINNRDDRFSWTSTLEVQQMCQKRPYIHQKRPMNVKRNDTNNTKIPYIKRDKYTSKEMIQTIQSHCTSTETYINQERPMYIKRDLYTSKETIQTIQRNHTSKETNVHQKRPIYVERDLNTSKETKQTIQTNNSSKETYIH